MKKILLIVLLLSATIAIAQVGIGTTTPKSTLDIPATNAVTPSNSDGILIPRINAFPSPIPTVDQNGMMVFLTTDLPGKPKGFYYWDDPTMTWKGVGASTPDADFYEMGTTTPPDAITDAMFHSGNVGIGNVNPTFKLDIEETAASKVFALRVKHSNAISGGTTSAIRADISGSFATGTLQGISNSIVPGAGTGVTGLYNFIQGTSTAEVVGVENNIQTIGTGARIAVENSVSGTGTGLTFGTQNTFSNSAATSYFGTYTTMATAGPGSKNGITNRILNSTGGFHTGVNNILSDNNGALEETGVYSKFSGASSGNIRGAYNEIDNSGNGVHYGLYNNIKGTGGVQRYGVENILSGTSEGIQYGVSTHISNTGNNTHYGTQNYLNGTGTGLHFGIRNWLTSTGIGEQTGSENLIDNSGVGIHKGTSNTLTGAGNGEQYGTYNYIANVGTGDKYGTYNKIFSTAGPEIHYGVYSDVAKAIGYAGYFLGRVSIGTTLANGYILPASRGTADQVMQTDASGNVSWKSANNFAWSLNGNSGYNPVTSFIGSTDSKEVFFRHTNQPAGVIGVADTSFGYRSLGAYSLTARNSAFGTLALENNSVSTENSVFGSEALNANTAGSKNVAVGNRALFKQAFSNGGLAYDGRNVAIGYGAMYATNSTATTNGVSNVGIGFYALANNGTGLGNIAIGASAMGASQTGGGAMSGNSNIGIGGASLKSNRSGSNNVAIGSSNLGYNNDGIENVGIGTDALFYSTNVSNGTAIGTRAMQNFGIFVTGTNDNVAVGYEALRGTNTTAAYTQNTVVGYQALTANASGNYNSAFGYKALNTNSSGGSNTAIGNSALFSNSTGTGNVALGYQAGYNEMGSNKLYVDNSNTTAPLIYGDFSTDLLRANANVRIKSTTAAGGEMQIKNSNFYNHNDDNNLNFGSGLGYFMMSTTDANAGNETGGIRGDGDNVAIWSPGDGNRLLRILDEDFWLDNNGNPYDNGAEKAYIDANGNYVQVSDRNKKDNIRKIDNPIEKIMQIGGYTYQFKLSAAEIEKGQAAVSNSGVLAQEIKEVLPEAVQQNESGEYFVNYAAITPLLIETVKAQQHKIDDLEMRLKAIEDQLK